MSDATKRTKVPGRLGVPYGRAICYSGYREGQSPDDQIFPSYEQIHEDLRILARDDAWQYLRVYDSGPHAQTTLQVIDRENLPFKVMLGMASAAEQSNPKCPWGADYPEKVLRANRKENRAECRRAIELAQRHPDTVFSVSIGNEATVEWSDHIIPLESLLEFVDTLRAEIDQPLTFCENYVPWVHSLKPLADQLDFLSVHSYPVWEYKSIGEAMDFTRANLAAVAKKHPDKPLVISEAGWTTASNGRGIEPRNASQKLQARYVRELLEWADEEQMLVFVFEAFDEPWKGSPDPLEPEKHWGLYSVGRAPKLVVQQP